MLLKDDDDLMMKYLEGEEISVEEIKSSSAKSYIVKIQQFLYAAVQHTETKVFRNS